jgi:hypothetical protein
MEAERKSGLSSSYIRLSKMFGDIPENESFGLFCIPANLTASGETKDWPAIDEVSAATEKPRTPLAQHRYGEFEFFRDISCRRLLLSS